MCIRDSSKSITKKDEKIQIPNTNERKYSAHDKFCVLHSLKVKIINDL